MLDDVPEAATVVGVPAKIVRQGPVGDELPAALDRMALMMEANERRARAADAQGNLVERSRE